MIPRAAHSTLLALATHYPVVVVTGPRQSGKTTLAKAAFPDHPYVSLENLDLRSFASQDPRGFLAQVGTRALIDEAQRVPTLFSYLQEEVDNNRQPGRFILTGSAQPGLRDAVSQTLAGRAGHLHLLPLSLGELLTAGQAPTRLDEWLFAGGYPAIHANGAPARLWLSDYLATYLERDVRQIANLRHLSQFQQFVGLCAGHIGQQIDLSKIGGQCGVSHVTIREWLSILEVCYLVFRLPPYSRNFCKRLVKTPKLYFHDTGLAARLLGLQQPADLRTHFAAGALFENWVASEWLKICHNHRADLDLTFFRSYDGLEVDLVGQLGSTPVSIECKLGATFNSEWLNGLLAFQKMAPDEARPTPHLVYGGTIPMVRQGVRIVPWRELPAILKQAVPATL